MQCCPAHLPRECKFGLRSVSTCCNSIYITGSVSTTEKRFSYASTLTFLASDLLYEVAKLLIPRPCGCKAELAHLSWSISLPVSKKKKLKKWLCIYETHGRPPTSPLLPRGYARTLLCLVGVPQFLSIWCLSIPSLAQSHSKNKKGNPWQHKENV